MKSMQPKAKLKKLWIAIGGLVGFIAIAIGIVQIFQTGILAKGDEAIALTQIALQVEQNQVLKDIATLQSADAAPGPTATAVAQQIQDLEVTKEALADSIAAMEATRKASPEEPEEPIIIPTRYEIPNSNESSFIQSSDTEIIPFTASQDTNSLAADWKWVSGSSESSNYRFENDNELILIAGPSTNLWDSNITAPYIEKELSGNFQVQVKIDFDPTEKYQVAGFGLRSSDDPSDWVRIARYSSGGTNQFIDIGQTTNGRSESFSRIPYAKTTVYLRIKRVEEALTFSISENDTNWFDLNTDYIFSLPEKVQLFLFVYSTSGHGTLAQFSDLHSSSPQLRRSYVAGQDITFVSNQDVGRLNENMGWYPGNSTSSSIEQKDNSLTIISGPGTNLWDSTNTSPRVELLATGDLVTQVKLDFTPSERYQAAGIGLRSSTDSRDWIFFRRSSAGANDQKLVVARTLDNRSEGVTSVAYAGTTVYLQIARSEPLISFYYSSDGISWEPLIEDFVMGFPDDNWLFLSAYSTTGNGIQATFSDLTLSPP